MLIFRQPVFALTPNYFCVLKGKATNTTACDLRFDLPRAQTLEPLIYYIQGEYANH